MAAEHRDVWTRAPERKSMPETGAIYVLLLIPHIPYRSLRARIRLASYGR
jgi:hypothetical protein